MLMHIIDETDQRLIAALRRDGRASVSELAQRLGLARATVRARIERLMARGEISGFTVLTRADLAESPVRCMMMIGMDGCGADRAVSDLQGGALQPLCGGRAAYGFCARGNPERSQHLPARDRARGAQDVRVLAIGMQGRRHDAWSIRRLQDHGTGAITKQHAGGSILPVHQAAEHL